MKIVKASALTYVPASHESPQNPGVLKKILAKRDDLMEGRIQMINWALLPTGKAFEAHYHEDMQEIFIILSGEAKITIGQESAALAQGDAVIIPPQAVHVMKNMGKIDVEYIAIGISREGTGRTVNV